MNTHFDASRESIKIQMTLRAQLAFHEWAEHQKTVAETKTGQEALDAEHKCWIFSFLAHSPVGSFVHVSSEQVGFILDCITIFIMVATTSESLPVSMRHNMLKNAEHVMGLVSEGMRLKSQK